MVLLIVVWLILFAFSFGAVGFIFISMKKAASKPWQIRVDETYVPKVSILVPTYNESSVIRYKLENLSKLDYPRDLVQVIVVDSNSQDQTVGIVNDFAEHHPEISIQVLTESEKRGKSFALNFALKHCSGDVIVVSDADCFWSHGILRQALPFLADSNIGGVSGPKILLNSPQSWVTKSEDAYLRSMNLMKLGESKLGSTLLFEGGFSAYKKGALDAFDPYNTGSDDCGSIMRLTEKGLRAILVPEAAFFSTFPATWRGKMGIKMRRSGQLARVFSIYISLLIQRRIKSAKRIVVQDVLLYLMCPVAFLFLLAVTIAVLFNFPYFGVLFLVLLVPKVASNLFELVQNYFMLVLGIFSLALNRRFLFWNKPEDRALLTEDILRRNTLI